jgi:hypothetical protein
MTNKAANKATNKAEIVAEEEPRKNEKRGWEEKLKEEGGESGGREDEERLGEAGRGGGAKKGKNIFFHLLSSLNVRSGQDTSRHALECP